jgi:drug/metabolite transporter (DMT)-like permease
MGAAVVCFSLVDATAKWLTGGYDPWQIIFLSRVVLMLAALYLAYRETGNPFNFRTRFPKRQALRAFLIIPMMWCFFEGLRLLSLSEAITISFVAPLFIIILSSVMLREKIGWRRWTAVAVGFVGVVVALRPGTGTFGLGAALVIFSAIAYAFTMVMLRGIAGREPMHNILFYGAVGAFLASAFAAVPVWVAPDPHDWGLLLLVGVFGLFGSNFTIGAYRRGEASMLAPLEYTALIWSVIFDLILFQTTPIGSVLLGAAIIIGSNLYIAHREHRLGKATAT